MISLEVKTLNISAGTKRILKDLSFKAEGGSLISVLGVNGAGKSTLLKALAGFINYQGTIFLNSLDIKTLTTAQRASKIAYLPQIAEINSDFSAEQIISMGRYHANRGKLNKNDYTIIKNCAEQTSTSELLKRNIKTLSGGERQRVLLASALAQEPELLLLDEPLTFMDPSFSSEFSKMIRTLCTQKNLISIQVTHELNTCLPVSDKIIVIQNSEMLFCGTPEDFIRSEALQKSYNHNFRVCKIPERDFPVLLNE